VALTVETACTLWKEKTLLNVSFAGTVFHIDLLDMADPLYCGMS
jgi:hypothetical protein